MKTFVVIVFLSILIFIYCLVRISVEGGKLIKKEDEKLAKKEALVGKSVLIDKDTFFVADYKFFGDCFTMKNGQKFDANIVLNAPLIK